MPRTRCRSLNRRDPSSSSSAISLPRRGSSKNHSAGLRHLPQRLVDQGRDLALPPPSIPATPRTRDRGNHRCRRNRCARLTFNSLRHIGGQPGDIVAVLGLGGLGHLGVQYAVKMGFKTVAIARGTDKAPLAKQLGAWKYIDSQATNPAEELNKLGGTKIILATAASGKAMTAVLPGLAIDGKMIVLGAGEPLEVSPFLLIGGRRSIAGWPSGRSIDSQDTMRFSVLSGVRSMNEVFPLERAPEAYERMMSGKARFRVVLTTGQ